MIQKENILKEAIYKAVRSGGSGGQHVNKVATCVQLFFDIHQSEVLDENQKNKLNKTKDVLYDKEKRDITSIPALYFNSQSRNFTLKIVDIKRVSTLKSLTPKYTNLG